MGATMQGFYVSLPSTEVGFFKELVRKMGWTMGRNRSVVHSSVEGEEQLKDIPVEIRSLIGVASSITEEDIAEDDKLAYLLNK